MQPSSVVLVQEALEPLLFDELLPFQLERRHNLGKSAFHRWRRGKWAARPLIPCSQEGVKLR